MNKERVRIPKLRDIDYAVSLYKYPHIDNRDIMQLFGCSRTKALQLKKLGQAQEDEEGVMRYCGMTTVSTACAYRAWGIDIEDLMRRQLADDKIRRRKKDWGLEA